DLHRTCCLFRDVSPSEGLKRKPGFGYTGQASAMNGSLQLSEYPGDPRHTGSKLSAKYCAATSHVSARFFGLRAIMSPAFGDPASLSASEMLTPPMSSPV